MLEGPRPEVFAKKKARGREVFALEEQLQLGILHSTGYNITSCTSVSNIINLNFYRQRLNKLPFANKSGTTAILCGRIFGHQGSMMSTSLWIGHDGEQDITNLLFNVKR